MGALNYFFHSKVLGCNTKITVTIPENYDPDASITDIYYPNKKFPTLYLCHGGSEDSTVWLRYTQLEIYAQDKQLMTVCFDSAESFCCDEVIGRNYFTYATEELPALVRSYFPSSPLREDNFVAGFSMGGHSAMKMALRRPDLYCACLAMSGAKDQVKMAKLAAERFGKNLPKEPGYAFGNLDERLYGTENDLLYLAKKLKESGVEAPMLYTSCGTKDYGYPLCKEFKEYLDKVGLKNEFFEVPDAIHDYNYANTMIKKGIYELFPIRNK